MLFEDLAVSRIRLPPPRNPREVCNTNPSGLFPSPIGPFFQTECPASNDSWLFPFLDELVDVPKGVLESGGVVKELHATTLGRILREQGFSFQRPKTWKESNDPEFDAKKNESARSTRKRRRTRE